MWCEAWMRRDDLSRGYDGWQVLDATSQDRQSGHYRVGPASVLAVKRGQAGKKWPHNVEFVRSQINADICYFRVTNNFSTASQQAISLARVNKGEVGTALVTASYTKTTAPLDLMADYRDVPSSESDSTTVSSSTGQITPRQISTPHVTPPQATPPSPHRGFLHPPTRDCAFDLKLSGPVKLGEDIEVTVTVCNNGAMLRTVDGRLVGTAVFYTGHMVRTFMSLDFSGLVSPGQSK